MEEGRQSEPPPRDLSTLKVGARLTPRQPAVALRERGAAMDEISVVLLFVWLIAVTLKS